MDLFARWTDSPEGDLQRRWCWQDHSADQYLPNHPLSDAELAEWVEEIRSYGDNLTAEALENDPPEWTGERWSVRVDGIPGILLDPGDEELSERELLSEVNYGANVGANVLGFLAIFRGRDLGPEQESEISCGNARLFLPSELVRMVRTNSL